MTKILVALAILFGCAAPALAEQFPNVYATNMDARGK